MEFAVPALVSTRGCWTTADGTVDTEYARAALSCEPGALRRPESCAGPRFTTRTRASFDPCFVLRFRPALAAASVALASLPAEIPALSILPVSPAIRPAWTFD